MVTADGFFAPDEPPRFGGGPPRLGVHALSEFVFCPRAGIIAHESAPDCGSEEPFLGPKLHSVEGYDELLFTEAIHADWADVRLWVTLMAPASAAVLIAWWFHSVFAATLVSLPLFYLLARTWDSLTQIAMLVRERAVFRAAATVDVDLHPTQVKEINWWSLRKAGFDCFKLRDALSSPEERLSGNPWRVLKKGTTVAVPVILRARGRRDWGRQHVVRLAAYCHLIECCEGRSAPFGVIMFAGTYDCMIIPMDEAAKGQLDQALSGARELLELDQKGTHIPAEPTDNRCTGCAFGKPVRYRRGKTDTVLNGVVLRPRLTNSVRETDRQFRGAFHCTCGDRFGWVPPHRDAVALGIAEERA